MDALPLFIYVNARQPVRAPEPAGLGRGVPAACCSSSSSTSSSGLAPRVGERNEGSRPHGNRARARHPTPSDRRAAASDPGSARMAHHRSLCCRPPIAASSAPEPTDAAMSGRIETAGLNVYYGAFRAIRDITLTVKPHAITAIIGPSGCGKSTFLRTLNRMHELTPDDARRGLGPARRRGHLRAIDVDPVALRRVVGMVFQRPNPFPTMSIYDNVVAGLRLTGRRKRAELDEIVERSLRRAALWDEVKDKLKSGGHLAVGRPAAAAVHRARPRGRPRGHPDGRAGLGARPGRDAPDRGADGRAARRTTRSSS